LLRSSRNTPHPEGIGNAGGALGRYLAGHSTGLVFPLMGMNRMKPTHTKSFAINDFYESSPGWAYPTGVIQMSGQIPFWREVSGLTRPIARYIADHALTSFYMTEALPARETGYRFDGDRLSGRVEPIQNLKTFRHLRKLTVGIFRSAGFLTIARRRPPYLWHEVGTARMGTSAADSVVDPDLQVHGVTGLHIVDASVLPTAGAVNTGLTIMALAARLGARLSA
jgi:choline dehydrogenase-like flavoprotein